MNLELSEEEKCLLLEVIERKEAEGIQSLDRADTRSFKHLLKKRLQMLASIKSKLRESRTRAA
jgi:hypothetical protein